jgi:hypothetical protein
MQSAAQGLAGAFGMALDPMAGEGVSFARFKPGAWKRAAPAARGNLFPDNLCWITNKMRK